MPNRYGDYLVKRGDNLGDPSFWNRRFKDVDARIAANEDQRNTLDAVIEEGRVVFREKANDVLLPLINEVYEAANVGLMLRVTSATEHQVSTGGKTFVVDEGQRLRYAPPAYVAVYRMENPRAAMLGEVVSWDAGTGELTVDIDRVSGSGDHGGWTITAASPSDTAEAIAEVLAAVDAVNMDRQAAEIAAGVAGEKADLTIRKTDEASAFAASASDDADRSQAAVGTLEDIYAAQSRVYLGAFAADPASDLNGDPLVAGAEYWNTTDGIKKIYDGSGWTVSYVPVGSEVTSIFGRMGNVSAKLGDYSADKITAAVAGLDGNTVQGVLGSIKAALDAQAAAAATALSDGLATKADSDHTHAFSEVTGTPTTLAGYGIADGRTAEQIADEIASAINGLADTAYVDAHIAELADALKDNDSDIAAIQSSLATKLPAASYTAADVLAKLKTVDGVGSEIDADKLRGKFSTSAAAVTTVVERDAQGDIRARLFRPEFTVLNADINYFATQIAIGEGSANNYLRPSTPAQVVATLNGAGGIDADKLGGNPPSAFLRTSSEASLSDVLNGANGKFPDAATLKAALPSLVASVPVGSIMAFAADTPPSGWLECNGAAIGRTTYAALFASIGTTFGDGDGSTTFNLPDLRGEFVRGWDHGRGVDADRVFGSWQAGQIEGHTHAVLSEDGYSTDTRGFGNSNNSGLGQPSRTSAVSGLTYYDTAWDGQPYIENTGGTETRPRNVALLYCIKVFDAVTDPAQVAAADVIRDVAQNGLRIDALEGQGPQGIGIGQTWQDVTGSRTSDTAYQNTTGTPIAVSGQIGSTSNAKFQISFDGETWNTVADKGGSGGRSFFCFIVPDGFYYRFISGGLGPWWELR
ncbi:phage tail protein [Breoghania sp. JC706]|uniref:phage tail protein n=1 Tax=Breoghania sp. JC706 TaxID=3117732 RepID=UPI00300B17CB